MKKTLYSEQHQIFLEVLKSARETSGLTQTEVAERLGVSQSDISKCERGVRRLDVLELHSWCKALGVSLVVFVQDLDSRLAALAERRRMATVGRRGKTHVK